MPKLSPEPADEMRMKEADFDDLMRGALGVPAPVGEPGNDDEPKVVEPRLSAYPAKKPRS